MRRSKFFYVLAGAILALAFSAHADTIRRVPLYRTGIFSDAVGPANLLVRNVYGNSTPEIVSCSQGSAFALTRVGGGYRNIWHTAPVGCNAVAVGDVNGDGAAEAIVGTLTSGAGSLLVYTPYGFAAPRASVVIPGSEGITDVAIGNVDADPAVEVVALTLSNAYIYNAATLALEWTAAGRGGHTVAIADLEGDGAPEIVISGGEGHVLDGATQSFKWGYVGGFGQQVAVGDVDADGRAEIVGTNGTTIRIIHGDTFTTSTFSLIDYHYAQALAVGDGNNDGRAEIVVGEDQWGDVRAYSDTGTPLWYVDNPEHGVSGIGIGDPDGDGANEAVWGAGWTSTGTDGLYVGNTTTHALEWSTPDVDGPFFSAAADLDGDGDVELVVATASMDSGYDGGSLAIHDLQGNITPLAVPLWATISQVGVGQLDADPAREIAILTNAFYNAQIQVYDGVTHALEWSSPVTNYGTPGINSSGPMIIRNIDGDPVDEIIVSLTNYKIQVLNGASEFVQNSTAPLDGTITSADIGLVTPDAILDLVVGTSEGYYVFRTSDLAELHHTTLSSAKRVAATTGQFAVATNADWYYTSGSLRTYSGNTFALQWQCDPVTPPIAMRYTTALGAAQLAVANTNTLTLYSASGASCPVPSNAEHPLANIVNFQFADLTGDGNAELIVGTYSSLEVDLFALNTAPRGDADGDGMVIDADMDALTRYFFGDGAGIRAGADVNGDFALRPDDLFYLINYRRGTGAAPPQ